MQTLDEALHDALSFLDLVPNVWKSASITDEPEIKLYQWQIKKMKEGSFFCGVTSDGNGRVSTDIKTFDEATKKGITASGRCYQLVGPEGSSSNADYVWNYYKRVNCLTEL
jgi:hypothetical protein